MTGPCSIALLESALAGNLSAEREESLHRHLEECEACATALEQMAGGAAWCQEAAALLVGDELDEDAPARDEWSVVDFTVEHLEPSDEPGVLGRLGGYDVLEIIGRGGMGVVLKGFDRELKRYVAIKALAPHLAQSSLAKKRFAREAQAAAAVMHPNVLAIHQVQPGGRLPFLVMPLVAGESLAQRLVAQGRLELKETLRLGMQAAAGLAAAHEQGLVHRDVKPANILLEKGVERAVLTDFGLARAADDVSMTRWGIIAGTPQYMSPEQARGEPLDGRSDLFSLGCVLYEMATGISPFRADSTLATLRRLIDEAPPALASLNPELPPWFIGIVDRLLEKDPARRFGSAKEVSELLEGCLAHLQQPATVPLPAALPAPAAGRGSRLRKILVKGVVPMIATLGIALLGIFLVQSTEPPDIAGQWSGEGWGQVVLTQTAAGQYAGTYSETVGEGPGKIEVKWSRIERRFNGTWSDGEDRFGELSLRLVDHEIRGALTTDPKSKINPATPRLADLLWTQGGPVSKNASSDPLAELWALQGKWKVMQVGKGRDADRAWADIVTYGSPLDPGTMDRFDFLSENHFGEVPDLGSSPRAVYLSIRNVDPRSFSTDIHLAEVHFYYRLNPSSVPKTIDLCRWVSHPNAPRAIETVAVGIYELHDDHLKICLTRYSPSLQEDTQRPKDFTRALSPDSVLFEFERYRPSDAIQSLHGDWTVVSQMKDGKPTEDGKFQKCRFDDPIVSLAGEMDGNRVTMDAIFALDPANQITFWTHYDEWKYRVEKIEFRGIYRLDGDRLAIAFRKGEPPKKLESTPGSGVTFLVLEKSRLRTIGPPGSAGAAAQPKAPRSIAMPQVPPTTEAERAVSRLVLVYFQDRSRRALPAVLVNAGPHTLIVTTGPATIIPDGSPPAIDRSFLEFPGCPAVKAEYVPESTKELSVFRAEPGLTSYRPDNKVALAAGDVLSAVIPGSFPEYSITPNAAIVTAVNCQADLNLPDPLVKIQHFDQLVELDRPLPEGTPLFKDGKLAGLTLLGSRFLGETGNKSYVVPADRIATLCSRLEGTGGGPTADSRQAAPMMAAPGDPR